MKLSVVVPAYCEAERVGSTVAALREALSGFEDEGGVEIIVVDDGSGDGTAARARDAGADVVVEFAANRGKGAAVRAGILASSGSMVAFTDADLAYPPHQISGLLEVLEAGAEVVAGDRRHSGSVAVTPQPLLRRAGSRLVAAAARGVLGQRSGLDTQCGLKAFQRDAALDLARASVVDRFAFDVELLFLAERWRLDVRSVAVELVNRQGSSVRMVQDGLRLLLDMVRIRARALLGRYPRRGEGSHTAPSR